jgi:minor histocompatibility antigen H13
MLLSIAKTTVGLARWRKLSHLTLTLSQDSDRVFQLRYPTVSLVILPLALYPPVVYLFFPTIMERQYSVLMDIMGLSLSFMALSTIKIDSLMTGVVLLSGLFLYDIWWVFGSKPVFGTSVVSTFFSSWITRY